MNPTSSMSENTPAADHALIENADNKTSSTDHDSVQTVKKNSGPKSKRGERRIQILQALAHMLEQPNAEKITTAGLGKGLDISEAALDRHFARKAQMF